MPIYLCIHIWEALFQKVISTNPLKNRVWNDNVITKKFGDCVLEKICSRIIYDELFSKAQSTNVA